MMLQRYSTESLLTEGGQWSACRPLVRGRATSRCSLPLRASFFRLFRSRFPVFVSLPPESCLSPPPPTPCPAGQGPTRPTGNVARNTKRGCRRADAKDRGNRSATSFESYVQPAPQTGCWARMFAPKMRAVLNDCHLVSLLD